MKKIFVILILALFLIAACVQQPTTPEEPETAVEEPQEPQPICTERWVCQDENTKAYRKSDCTFEQITNCPAGCENSACKEVTEEPKTEPKEEVKEEPKEETKESCAIIGWKCLDEKRKGYQSSNCMFSQVEECSYGCKDGECIKTAPPEEQKEETFSLTEGTLVMNKTGWKYTDFSKNQIFLEDINEYDFKIKLYATASGYNYLRAESYRSDLWIIGKGIKEATRSDCIKTITGANAYVSLRTSQTLCIQTRENDIALIGGYWEGLPKEGTELTWKYYTPK